MQVMEHISATERRIIRRVLTNISDLLTKHPGLTVNVHDEAEMVYSGPFDRKKIEEEIGHTGMTTITVKVPATQHPVVRATVLFIHGNEEDVLSDSGCSEGGEWLEQAMCVGEPE
ncbi:hypothetical protein [Paracoccus litorisediminis]|uniref:Uncharacterized protein n=1 Tax=Paracoccus litorisediminis TaxID=2006130 RepID=A0A844HPT6_9RHOB|nr:hypothetical protein [Paracoccus litorisediminis]MTH61149.1 hypothetical protein [Paracoccus litorisediminis]